MKEEVKEIEALKEWRERNWKRIMNKNKKILETIRDDTNAAVTARVEAAKTLARMVSGLQPDRIVQTGKKDRNLDVPRTLSPEKLKEIDELKEGNW